MVIFSKHFRDPCFWPGYPLLYERCTSVPVQVQHGNADCGVFAVAFATALCSGKDPTKI